MRSRRSLHWRTSFLLPQARRLRGLLISYSPRTPRTRTTNRSGGGCVLLFNASSPSSSSPSALCLSQRGFYSGLDEARVHRLRRSGMTFNRPRGRDTFSLAFESRLRLVPLTQMSDLYGSVDASLLTAVNAADPTSSAGSRLDQKKAMSGDDRMRDVMQKKEATEAALREKKDWHVLVVDPVALPMASMAPVPYPSPFSAYYHDWETLTMNGGRTKATETGAVTRHGTSFTTSTSSRWAQGRSVLEKRETPLYGFPFHTDVEEEGTVDCATTPWLSTPDMEGSTAAASASREPATSPAFFYHAESRRHLQQNGDTTVLPYTSIEDRTIQLPTLDASTGTQTVPHHIRQHIHTAVCVDPYIHHARFRREEAQVEMITAYRNILYEAVEVSLNTAAWPAEAKDTSSGSLRRTSATNVAPPYVADVIRIPALCHASCPTHLRHELGKLNQQSVIKGFHRLSNEAKEALIMNRAFTVEIYVLPMLFAQFERAFLEEAWPAPISTLNPGRTALYPGLAPPRTLLAYDGWVGKRPELVTAMETKGKSLLSGPRHALDGSLITEAEVLANLRVFGAREAEQRMLEGERGTAAASAGKVADPVTYAPLQASLQGESEAEEPCAAAASEEKRGEERKSGV